MAGPVMSFHVYILRSSSASRYYCGHTGSLSRRLKQHNDPDYYGTKTTKRFAGPWILVWEQACPTRSEAMKLERQIKKRGIKRYLADIGRVPPRRD